MKKHIFAFILIFGLMTVAISPARAVSLTLDDAPVNADILVFNHISYVPLRTAIQLLIANDEIVWKNQKAVVTASNLELTVSPEAYYLEANGRMLYIKDRVRTIQGSLYVPIRVLAKATGASVKWESTTDRICLTKGTGTILSGDRYYDATSLYWLSHIINAESGIEPLTGKIAVGDVILNRVKSADFPNSIYNVIFDRNWGTQFQPVDNGTIYDTPNAESVLAAKLCLDGASVMENGLYFLDPAKAKSLWIVQNCSYITTIGSHQFYA